MTLIGLNFVEQDPIPVWRQGVGWTSEYALEGTREQVDAASASYAGAAGVLEIRYQELGGGLWRASVAFAGKTREDAQNPPAPDSLVETSWAFPRNDLQRDIWTHPRIEAQLRNMGTAYRARFRADVEKWLQGDASIEVPTATGGTADLTLSAEGLRAVAVEFGADGEEIDAFFAALTEGQTSYIFSRRVLRLTRTGPTKGEWLASNTNTNRVFTRAGLISAINPPDWVALKMPSGYWFKHEPEEQSNGDRLETVQEFEYFGERYSVFAYGEPVA